MRFRTLASKVPTSRRAGQLLHARERGHSVTDFQRTVGNQAVLRLLRPGAPRHTGAAPAAPAQAKPPCQCGGTCPLCSDKEHADRDRLQTPAQDDVDFTERLDVEDEEAPEIGVLPPDVRAPAEGAGTTSAAPPLEAGWWTGDWYTDTNTIICDGADSLTIHEATSYKHGVQACTRQHENSHKGDWYARYGNDICKGRKKGDLPHFDPKGKEAYADFVKKSECTAWKIGQTCRNEKLAACKDDECKNYVKTFTTQADSEVKNYCG
jgi:hypothetical protein